jgi:hypothetical protein
MKRPRLRRHAAGGVVKTDRIEGVDFRGEESVTVVAPR